MTEAFSLMLWPLLACFVLVGIHAYLGIHVIARKVIFVDLALAQIAALGAVYGIFLGLSFDGDWWLIKGVSVSFTLLGALLFSFTKTPHERVPHEAIIGIIYAVALSATLLLGANLAHGAEQIQKLLSGNILWVTPREVLYTAILYGLVGVFHFVFRKQFFSLSFSSDEKPLALNRKWWDFLFYATFGVVVTSSVGMGGVLLVFAYLVIPSVIGIMLATSTKARLLLAWGCGLLISLLGVILSYFLDLPSGPLIVVLLGCLLLLIAIAREILTKKHRFFGFVYAVVIVFVVALATVLPLVVSHRHEEQHDIDIRLQLKSADEQEIVTALGKVEEQWLTALVPDVIPLLSSSNDKIRELSIKVLQGLGDRKAIPALKTAASQEKDDFILLDIARALLHFHEVEGLFVVRKVAQESSSEFAQEDAFLLLFQWLENAPHKKNVLLRWIDNNKAQIVFDNTHHKFMVR